MLRCKPVQTPALLKQSASSKYQKVFDSRKRRVRGMWLRNGQYFANLAVADDLGRKTSRWVPLVGTTFTEAKADSDRLRVEREDEGHKKTQAARVSFGPPLVIVPATATSPQPELNSTRSGKPCDEVAKSEWRYSFREQ